MHWMVCSVCQLGCMVANINAPFAERRITERDFIAVYFIDFIADFSDFIQILLLRILSGMEPIWNTF